ncbi:hypothetical protein [Bacillus sp. AFS017274]|uniref:hypothetical protein n=1 Tax=Bacillaceae TaxID=186817 RepID=UPI000BF59E8F|nr:hypothetical protein [Bacillus sp. AFS017274]PEZ80922.1 hypothetical protein CN380_14755 [Bacillus sp. AFS017274]
MKYKVLSKLEHKLLNARKHDKEHGYSVEYKKSGVFLKSAGEKVEPIFSKSEVAGEDDEYVMIFAPVKVSISFFEICKIINRDSPITIPNITYDFD